MKQFEIHMRSWETMEYTQPVYIHAENLGDAFDRADAIFRQNGYQVKTILPEGEFLGMDAHKPFTAV